MKTQVISTFLMIFFLAATSCKKEFPDNPLTIDNLTVSDCKSVGLNKGSTSPMYITLKTVNDYYIQYDHINSWFNCEPGQITVSFEMSSDSITLDENESSSAANCICPFDVSCRIGPLQYGTYTIKCKKGGIAFKELTIDFKKSMNIQVDLDN
jgi:hypothetical protein